MAANTADTLTNIESALGTISSSLGGFVGNKNYEDGIAKIESILTNNFRKTSAKNSTSTGTTNGGRTLGNTVGEILGVLKNIDKHFISNGSVSQGIKDVNKNVKDAVDLLRQIEQHIGNMPSNSTVSNTNSPTTNIDNIDKNVEGIYNELKKVAIILAKNSFKSGDVDLDKKLLKISNLQANRKLEEEEFDEKRRKAGKGKKEDIEEYKKALKEKRKEDKRLKKIEEGKFGAGGVTADIARGLTDTFTSFLKEKPDASKTIDKGISAASTALSAAGPWGALAGSIMQAIKGLFDLGADQDKLTTKFAREFGGGYDSKYNSGKTVRNFIGKVNRRYGATNEEAFNALTEVGEARGRTTERMSDKSVESAIMLKRFGIGADAINNFDTFGKSLEETDKYFGKLYNEVSKKGLSFKNVSKAVNDNLKAAQSHTFSNGLRGLEAMAERSVQLKYNMQQVFQFADKVSEVEGAINTAANLSVLGGTFAQYSNPMELLYEGLNDTEALQKRMESMFANSAQWNNKTGQIDMTGEQRRFVIEAAKGMGINTEDAISMAMNQAKYKQIEKDIKPGLNSDIVNYIKNIAELNSSGHSVVSINGEEKEVSGLDENDRELLKSEYEKRVKSDNAKLGDIYQSTMSVTEKMDNILVYLKERLGRWVFGIFQKSGDREKVAEENVRNWAIENKVDAEKALEFYRTNKDSREFLINDMSKNGARNMRTGRGYNDIDFSKNLDIWKEDIINGKSPNGFNPSKHIPGYSGILKGNSHENGGIFGFRNGSPWEAEGGEYLINKISSSKYRNELNKIQNGTFNPYSYSNDLIKNDMGRYFNQLNVAPTQNASNVQSSPNSPNSVNGRIKIDIPETITINLAGGEKIGDYNVREIVMQYVDKFMKEATMRKNLSGFNKEEFYNKSDVI